MVEFKVGDRVEIVGYGHGWDGPATVVSIRDSGMIEVDSEAYGDLGVFDPENVRLLTQADYYNTAEISAAYRIIDTKDPRLITYVLEGVRRDGI